MKDSSNEESKLSREPKIIQLFVDARAKFPAWFGPLVGR
jgi:hypothetical protein